MKIILKKVAHEIIDGIRKAEEKGKQIEAIALTHEEYICLCEELSVKSAGELGCMVDKIFGYDIFVGSPEDYELIHGHKYTVFKKADEDGNVSIFRDRIEVETFSDDDEGIWVIASNHWR